MVARKFSDLAQKAGLSAAHFILGYDPAAPAGQRFFRFPGDQLSGVKGPQGDKGPIGDQGPLGNTGNPGAPGDKGSIGDKGPVGDTGTKGATGDKGLTGDKGAVGDKGVTGDKGLTGDKGATGDKGVTGDKGLTGDKGVIGDKGPVGDQGSAGGPNSRLAWAETATLRASMMRLATAIADGFKAQDGYDPVASQSTFWSASAGTVGNRNPNDTYLQMRFEGANNSTVFTDDSGLTITTKGSAKISTNQFKTGASSYFGDGSSWLRTSTSTKFNGMTPTGTWSIKADIFITAYQSDARTIAHVNNAAGAQGIQFYLVNGYLVYDNGQAAEYTSTTNRIPLNAWTKVELRSDAGTHKLLVNDVVVVSRSPSQSSYGTPNSVTIGGFQDAGSNSFIGYIDDLVINNGGAVAFLDLRSVAFQAAAVPTKADITLKLKTNGVAVTPGTNFKVQLTRDNGVTYTDAPMQLIATHPDGSFIYDASNVDISGQPAGTQMKYRVLTVGTQLGIDISKVGFGWQ